MYRVGWILAILLALCWLATEIPLQNYSSIDQPIVQTCWRRTVDGWENTNQWSFYSSAPKPVLHPILVGLILCASVAWIGLFSYLEKIIVRYNANHPPHKDENISVLESKSIST